MRAGCNIPIPRSIQLKRAVVNVKSADNACFGWAVVAALYPAAHNNHRTSSYPHYSEVLNLQGINFPMSLNQIKKFEQLNNLSINVYGVEKDTTVPLRISNDKKERHINLLYIGKAEGGIGHFTWIKNLSRLVSSQLSNHNHRNYICDR